MKQKYRMMCFKDWNLPDLMTEAAGWIERNEINVCDLAFGTYEDDSNFLSNITSWYVNIYYVKD